MNKNNKSSINERLSQRIFLKKWKRIGLFFVALVVFCTVYQLILPAVTMKNETLCGVECHEHNALCYIESESEDLITAELSEEDQSAVDSTVALISALPDIQGLEDSFCAYESAEDYQGLWEFFYGAKEQIRIAKDSWLALSSSAQTAVGSQLKLIETEQKLHYLMFDLRVRTLTPQKAQVIAADLQGEIDTCHMLAELNDEDYTILTDAVNELLTVPAEESVAEEPTEEESVTEESAVVAEDGNELKGEQAIGTNWIALRDSGWFEEYRYAAVENSDPGMVYSRMAPSGAGVSLASSDTSEGEEEGAVPPSDRQVVERGGSQTSEDGKVTVSKTIEGTDRENVFDITLQVQTTENISEIYQAPDMAVVIVMDISNTMNSNFGGVTRYAAAMDAAEAFLDQFAANNTLGVSKIGYVAFNTHAHQIFGLQSCSTSEQATALKNTMRTQTGTIINKAGYKDDHSRFTNIEAGLAMASDMLNSVQNKNKYIIFLSDGFPTTYISSGYSGYDTYDSTGRFYDHVLKKKCLYGTSYSDEAAIRARQKASDIKNSGTKIFSIGVDVGGQTIQKYITQSENADGFSVVDRTGTTYEIGDASNTEAYKNWLGNSIGSGYYYDSTDSEGLKSAYNQIFEEIKSLHEVASKADWVASDPIPTVPAGLIEFIGFYDKNRTLVLGNLEGAYTPDGENTAAYDTGEHQINWDLKHSGYTQSGDGNTTIYTFELTYRVRLENENKEKPFREGTSYPTNNTTTLRYCVTEESNGKISISDPKFVEFPIPAVKGYLGELSFQKVDPYGRPVVGAEFTLTHDTEKCGFCRGDYKSSVAVQTQTSDGNGNVSFSGIPSGHDYILKETEIPQGYTHNGYQYAVSVAYDVVTVSATTMDGTPVDWDGKIVNNTSYELPDTGGNGSCRYIIGGICLMLASLSLYFRRRVLHRN